MNKTTKQFFTIFCWISALVGLVLSVLNANAGHAGRGYAVGFGVAAVVFLAAGVVLTRVTRASR